MAMTEEQLRVFVPEILRKSAETAETSNVSISETGERGLYLNRKISFSDSMTEKTFFAIVFVAVSEDPKLVEGLADTLPFQQSPQKGASTV